MNDDEVERARVALLRDLGYSLPGALALSIRNVRIGLARCAIKAGEPMALYLLGVTDRRPEP